MPKKPKVLLGMSGGVDSSVSAALLLEQGYEVIGGFMKNWSGTVCGPQETDPEKIGESFEECDWRDERRDAMRVASALGIPLVTFDFEEEYRKNVVEYLFREAEAGRTPNPDVMCNKFMKFDLFLKEADKLGCDFIATGHYARVKDGKILAGVDKNKDQTYFLWAIDPAVVPRVLFPLGEMEKPAVREKARELKLPVAEKKDSVGICFVGEVNMKEFLAARIKKNPGNIMTTTGEVVGTHDGLAFYTIGQREGLNIALGEPMYVVEKRVKTNELVVASNFNPELFASELSAHSTNWFTKPETPHKCLARIRYRQELQPCTITKIENDYVEVVFDEPQRAITPGQSIVFYDGDEMIGGAIIEK